jgi:aspartate kinase
MAKVFKFGGASLKDAASVKNMLGIIRQYKENLIIVVSAMGKTTRALHQVVKEYYERKNFDQSLDIVYSYHMSIIEDLFNKKNSLFQKRFDTCFSELRIKLAALPTLNFDYEYDKIVSYGEIFSSLIVNEYLNFAGISNKWVDIRHILKSDSIYRDARINWPLSEELVRQNMDFEKEGIYITQGFIASDNQNNTTTLGLEGSDFSAAILSYFIDAEQMVVWKDVPGIYNSDPSLVKNVIILDAISYREAAELAYYGAKVIHPKTIKPLENKNISLLVKSFKEPYLPGTIISLSTTNKSGVEPAVPVFISKNNQILISIAPNDFSFIAEDNLEHIFSVFCQFRIKVNLMQNSAISFSVCVDYEEDKILPAIETLKSRYKVLYNNELTLITIRHFDSETINETTYGRKVYLQQKSRHTARFVVK